MKQLTALLALMMLLVTFTGVAEASNGVHAYIQAKASKRAADRYAGLIIAKAKKHGLPPILVAHVVKRESDFDPRCVTGDCVGLMQVNPSLWAKPGENMFRPADNLEAGCRLLARLHRRFGGWGQALTAYNFGENHRVTREIGFSRYARLVLEGR